MSIYVFEDKLIKVVIIYDFGQKQKTACWKYNRSSQNFTDAFFMLFFIISNTNMQGLLMLQGIYIKQD